MKKVSLLFILCILFLMNGCKVNQPTTTTFPDVTNNLSSTDITDNISSSNSTSSASYFLPTVEPDYFELLCENFVSNVYMKASGMRFFDFYLISARNLDNSSILLCTDIGEEFEAPLVKANYSDHITLPTIVAYQNPNFDWKGYAGNEDAFAEEMAQYKLAYYAALGEVPELYFYNFQVNFKQLGIDENSISEVTRIKTITVTIGDQKKEYEFGNLVFIPEELPIGSYKRNNNLDLITMGLSGVKTYPSADGNVEVPGQISMTAEEDIVLQSISFEGKDGIKLTDCKLNIATKQGGMYELAWDGSSPIEIDKESELELTVEFSDPSFANALIGNAHTYMLIHYTDKGIEYVTSVELEYHLRPRLYEIYAMKVDNVDVLPYYIDYYNNINTDDDIE